MASTSYQEIKDSLRQLYLVDPRPWLVGFSGGKDSTMLASLVFDAVLSVPPDQRKKPVAILCTDTRVEIPAVAEGVESALERMRRCSQQHNLNIEAQLLRPPPEQSHNIIGRGYPPPNRVFRWCTQRLKIDPVTVFMNQRLGHWGEAIFQDTLSASTGEREEVRCRVVPRSRFPYSSRRAESSTRAQTMAGREARNGLSRHPDLPRVWVSNPIQFLTTEEVWAYLRQKQNPLNN
jgi:DNA sulfur modification protein DndC